MHKKASLYIPARLTRSYHVNMCYRNNTSNKHIKKNNRHTIPNRQSRGEQKKKKVRNLRKTKPVVNSGRFPVVYILIAAAILPRPTVHTILFPTYKKNKKNTVNTIAISNHTTTNIVHDHPIQAQD